MRERLLICDSCGVEQYYTEETLQGFISSDCECPECGDVVHQDHGWIEVEA